MFPVLSYGCYQFLQNIFSIPRAIARNTLSYEFFLTTATCESIETVCYRRDLQSIAPVCRNWTFLQEKRFDAFVDCSFSTGSSKYSFFAFFLCVFISSVDGVFGERFVKFALCICNEIRKFFFYHASLEVHLIFSF